MKIISLVFVLMAAFCVNAEPFKIMSFNIRHGKTLKNQVNLAASASVIKKESPRFVGLQEVDLK